MSNSQVQLKISLSPQLSDLIKSKAQKIGVPVTQYIKYIIIKEVEKETFPTFTVSDETEKKTRKALEQINKSEIIDDAHDFFEKM